MHLPFLPDIKGIRTIRAGLHLGTVRGRIAVPDHAAAMWFGAPKEQALSLCAEDAQRYTAGETVPGDMSGWTLLKYADLILGWGKGSDGVIKNHYPKGIRNPHLIP